MKPALGRTDWLAALASGLLLVLSFPPWNLSWCIWIALVPLFLRIKTGDRKHNAWLGLGCGIVFYASLLYWLYHTTIGGMILLVVILSSIQSGFAVVVGHFKKYPYWIPLTALTITLIEYLRSLGLFSFAWGYLGHALYSAESLKQPVYWIGVPGLSFVIAGTNASLAGLIDWGLRWKKNRSAGWIDRESYAHGFTLLFAGSILAFFLYGRAVTTAINEPTQEITRFRVALVQGGFDQNEKESTDSDDSLDRHLKLSKDSLVDRPDLIVWPESAITIPVNYWHEGVERITAFVQEADVELLVGAVYGEYMGQRWEFWNRAILFSPDIPLDLTGQTVDMRAMQSYSKIHLVPFGEWVPWVEYWPFSLIETLIEEAGAGLFERGTELTIFKTRHGVTFATAICFESTRSTPFRNAKKDGAAFFVNITNDAWFKRSPGLEQHFSHCAFRAAENRRYTVRAANTGITGIFDPAGTLVTAIPPHTPGVCVGELIIPRKN